MTSKGGHKLITIPGHPTFSLVQRKVAVFLSLTLIYPYPLVSLRVQPYDLMYDCYRDPNNGLADSDGDSEDSNEENHYGE